jgi:acetate kinase
MLLVVNAGSSSVKIAVFDAALTQVARGMVSEIGGASVVEVQGERVAHPVADHEGALMALLQGLAAQGLPLSAFAGAGHRIVHGGAALQAPCRITPQVEAAIAACVPLAPLHNPANLQAVRALARLAPDLPQYASFDTAFHATNPEVATAYALPAAERARGLRRYGFHGLSYAAMVARLGGAGPLPRRLLALHLGNGASACAILDGASVASTMGYSPLDGLTMGTRSGAIDGNAVLRLAELHGIDGAARLLNRESGLLGLGGASDMRALHAAHTPEAAFALEHFAYWAVRHSGSLVAAMGGLDAVAFTGGIGENDAAMRAAIIGGLAYLGARLDPARNAAQAERIEFPSSPVVIYLVPAEEERQIAREAALVKAREANR